MKRAYSESDFEDERHMTERFIEGSEEAAARKRRRGLIEKKRRDRINSCLTELRHLVPAAIDKQGSTKLEKAEILQLTVEHLKNVRNLVKQDTAFHESAQHRAAGFRECLSEVSRYLQSSKAPECKNDQKAQLMSYLNSSIAHRLTTTPHVCQSRFQMTPPVTWPLTRGMPEQGFYHDSTTVVPFPVDETKTGQWTSNVRLHANMVSKDRTRLIKKPNVLISTGIPNPGAQPMEGHYPLTMYPTIAQRNENGLMTGLPLPAHRNNTPSRYEQIMFGASQCYNHRD